MRFTLSWLKDYLDTDATIDEILSTLNKIGLEVEEVIDKTKELEPFKSVLVDTCIMHPDSDHLHICTVKTVKDETFHVVCGAPNVKAGMKAIFAPVGSIIPYNSFKLTKAKIRGVESQGMLCSYRELGLGEDHTGIIELDPNTEIGKSVAEIFGVNDPVIEISLTPNRGDCLGIYGIARDLSAAGLGKLRPLKHPNINDTINSPINLQIIDENCPSFSFRYIKGLKNCESPDSLKNRLIAVGLTPHSALVDITNYVMLCVNRPMHCYDAKKINGDIIVRSAIDGEKFVALNNKEYTLKKGMTVIADVNKILGLGGVMGALDSASTLDTVDIILESANFNAINTAKTGRILELQTDSRYRYERGLDNNASELALNLATELILNICGGKVSDIVSASKQQKSEKNKNLDFDLNFLNINLGMNIEREATIRILRSLGFIVQEDEKKQNILHLIIPNWRNDISIKEDIVDEVIRIYGYDKLPTNKITDEKINENESHIENREIRNKIWLCKKMLASQNMDELLSLSFINDKIAKEFSKINENLYVKNPISFELNYMRQNIVPNILLAIQKNLNRGFENICFFEEGKIFISNTPGDEEDCITGIRYGYTSQKDVHNSSRPYDIFDVKKDLFDCIKLFGYQTDKLYITRETPNYYHPAKSGCTKVGNVVVGYFGELHPEKYKLFDLKEKTNIFELFIDRLPKIKSKNKAIAFVPNDLQGVKREFAFIVDKDIEVGQILNCVKNIDKKLITDVNLFDIYKGEPLDSNKKSIAFSVVIQQNEKTLTKEELEDISQKLIDAVEKKFNAELRDK